MEIKLLLTVSNKQPYWKHMPTLTYKEGGIEVEYTNNGKDAITVIAGSTYIINVFPSTPTEFYSIAKALVELAAQMT
jgi:hypothetical protein